MKSVKHNFYLFLFCSTHWEAKKTESRRRAGMMEKTSSVDEKSVSPVDLLLLAALRLSVMSVLD